MKNLIKILSGIVCVLGVAFLIVTLSEDNINIYYGVRVFRTIRMYLAAVTISVAVADIALVVTLMRQARPAQKDYDFGELRYTSKEKNKIAKQLVELVNTKWSVLEVEAECSRICKHLVRIDEYCQNLKEVLRVNEKDEIADAVEMLLRIEDNMYTNVQRLINYLYSMSSHDKSVVVEKAKLCASNNKTLVHKAKDFMLSVTDYINKSIDDDERSLALVQNYKQEILDMLDTEDLYLE